MIILLIAFLMVAAPVSPADVISSALDNYENVRSYRVTLKSGSGGDEQIVRYYYRKPGFVKMVFVKPHAGAVLVYSPLNEKVKTVPFRFMPFFSLTLDPDNIFIRSPQGHTIDESDLGALLESAAELDKHGRSTLSGEEDINGRPSVRMEIEGEKGFRIGRIHTYKLWLDKESLMPVKASSYDTEGGLIEEVQLDDLEINVVFPDGFFGESR